MIGWHHWLNGHEFEKTLGDSEGQGSLAFCSSWLHKELDTTEWLNKLAVQTYDARPREGSTKCPMHRRSLLPFSGSVGGLEPRALSCGDRWLAGWLAGSPVHSPVSGAQEGRLLEQSLEGSPQGAGRCESILRVGGSVPLLTSCSSISSPQREECVTVVLCKKETWYLWRLSGWELVGAAKCKS